MKLAKVKATLTRNKTGLMILGAVAVAGVALVARKNRAPEDAAAPVGQDAGSAQVGALAPYDSTASDVYNSIQPQIEALQKLFHQLPVGTEEPAPPPADPPTYSTTRGPAPDPARRVVTRPASPTRASSAPVKPAPVKPAPVKRKSKTVAKVAAKASPAVRSLVTKTRAV